MAMDLVKSNVEVQNESSTCIKACFAALEGGVVLDMTGVTFADNAKVLRAGHPVYMDASTGKWKPLKVVSYNNGTAHTDKLEEVDFDTKGGVGVLLHDVKVSEPVAAIMLAGVMNLDEFPYHWYGYKKASNFRGIVMYGKNTAYTD